MRYIPEIAAILAAFLVAGLVLLGKWLWRPRNPRVDDSPLWTLNYTPINRLLSNKNILSLVIGAGICVVIALAIATFVWLVSAAILPRNQHWVVPVAIIALGLVLGGWVAYPLFEAGRFTVPPGKTAYVSILNVPWTEMEVGDAWILPRIMQSDIEDSQAFLVPNETEAFITGNGISVKLKISCTAYVADPLFRQKISTDNENVQRTISRLLSTSTRQHISTVEVEDIAHVGNLERMSSQEQWQFVMRIQGFKGNIIQDGPERIRAILNEQLRDFGLQVEEGQVQISEITLPENIEEAINNIFSEIFQKVSLTNDARNKTAVAAIFNDALIAGGVYMGDLDREQRAEIVRENLDRALAVENQAKINVFHFRGKTPPGMFLNTNGQPN